MNIGNIMKKIFLIFPLLLISCSNNNSSIIKYSFNIDKKTATVVLKIIKILKKLVYLQQ